MPTRANSWKLVKRAEDAGFFSAWFYGTQVLSADIFVAMEQPRSRLRRSGSGQAYSSRQTASFPSPPMGLRP